MANNDSSLVSVGTPLATGAIFVAPLGSTLPTDATTALSNDYKCLGYASEDGVKLSEESDSEQIKAWGGVTVRVANSSFSETLTFTPMQLDVDVMQATYGEDNVELNETTGKMTVKHSVNNVAPVVLVIETIPAPDKKRRYVVPSAKLTERGDSVLNGTESDGRELTYTCQADGDGFSIYDYIDGFPTVSTAKSHS